MYNFEIEDCKFTIYLKKTHMAWWLCCLLRSQQAPEPVSSDAQVDVLTYLSPIMEAAILKNLLFNFQCAVSRPSRLTTGKARVLIVI